MFAIYTLFSLIFLWLSLAGMTLITQQFVQGYAIARVTGVLFFCLILFFIEHFIGLGSLTWAFPLTTIFGAWSIYNKWNIIKATSFWRAEVIFILAFAYGFFWRLMYPNISPSSEQVTDLFFIVNYLPGTTLPPLDHWNPPHLFDYYYAFQHYAAALLGRIMGLDPGATYSYAIALITALPITLAWYIGQHFIKKPALNGLLVATMVIGGTGMSPLFHAIYDNPANAKEIRNKKSFKRNKQEHYARENIIGSARFIGGRRDMGIATDKTYNAFPGAFFFPNSQTNSQTNSQPSSQPLSQPDNQSKTPPKTQAKKMILPSENFGYQYFIGDYHPSLGGFFLLLFVLALIISIEKKQQLRLSQGLLTLCVPLMMITNTWTFPLVVFLIGGWLIYRLLSKQSIDWLWLFGGGVVGTFLIYPFLIGFTSNSLDTPVKFVEANGHTPISRFLSLQWPVLLLIAISFFEAKFRKLAITFALTWLFMLGLSEVIYIDDPTGDHFRRTNTVMKWWGWIQVGTFISLGAICLGSSQKIIRWATCAIFILVNTYAIDVTRYWWYSGKWDFGKLHGHQWYTRDRVNAQMFEYLDSAPYGIVLENVYDNAYVNTSIHGIFNQKPVVLGWRSHLMTWHGSVPREWILGDEIQAFYRAEKSDPTPWLIANDVQYIIFTPKDDNTRFDAINNAIKSHYEWKEFNHSRARHQGIWVRYKTSHN